MTRYVTTTEAAALLNVPADLIAKWKHRGKVAPVDALRGQGRGGLVPLYRLDELQPLADQYHHRSTHNGSARDTPTRRG